ncbi:MAG: D-glycero-beta-D-manno-heptose 1,7-bisphosphate 7-phosphatase [Pseudomonadota bacterium]
MKWIVLDRDGVVNHDSSNYIKSAAEWQPVPGSLEAIARLTQAGWRVCLATNQAGLGRKLFDYDAFAAMNAKMQKLLAERGGRIDAVAFAPEHPDQATEMRKPNPGMLKDLARRLGAPLEDIWFVGDSEGDLGAARAAGMKPALVRSGNGIETAAKPAAQDVPVFDDLASFVSHLLAA